MDSGIASSNWIIKLLPWQLKDEAILTYYEVWLLKINTTLKELAKQVLYHPAALAALGIMLDDISRI